MTNDIQILAQSVVDGVATEEQRGMATRAVQNQLSLSLLGILNDATVSANRLNDTCNKALTLYLEKVNAALDQDLVSEESLLKIIDTIQSKQIQIAELYRKIIQSPKGLFSEDCLSEEEKKVMRLFKSFKTVEERKKFLELCSKQLQPEVETFD